MIRVIYGSCNERIIYGSCNERIIYSSYNGPIILLGGVAALGDV